jgi:hypothetical protein
LLGVNPCEYGQRRALFHPPPWPGLLSIKDAMIRALLLDIEGTTSSLEFVRDVLFPYAREHLAAFIAERRGDAEVDALLAESERLLLAEGASTAEPVAALERWMAEDRKVSPLKAPRAPCAPSERSSSTRQPAI